MIHNDIQNQLQLLIKTSAPPLIEVAQHAAETPQWTPGQRLPAHVLASLPNGRFEVRVGDQVLDLNLPRNTQPGDTLDLTYVASSPRLTFALTRDLPGTLLANSQVALSDAAKYLGSLLQKGAATAGPALPGEQAAQAGQASQAATRLAPVLNAPPADVAQFAQALKQAVSQSGLFYESHQVQWLSGQRTLAALRHEPQGQLPPLLPAEAKQPPPGQMPPGPAGLPQQQAQPPRGMETLPVPGMLPPGGERMAAEPVHPQATQLVQQQLQTLDTRQMVWQGQIWPGQEMYWEIEEDASRPGSGEGEEAASWHTRLNLQLPVLGGIQARLAFVNGALKLDIAAADAATAELMRGGQQALAERFDASGLQLTGMAIHHE